MEFLFAFVIGLIFGSFENVIIYRLKNGRNIVFGRSFCTKCKTKLKWYDLIPIFSFIFLSRRCRYCHKKISWQYPIVEILSGFIWLLIFYKNFNSDFYNLGWQLPALIYQSIDTLYQIVIISGLLVIAVYDFKYFIIPDKLVYPMVAIAFIYDILNAFTVGGYKESLEVFITALTIFLFLFLIYFFSKGHAIGLGDAKLAFLIGLFLKPLLAGTALAISFIIGAVCGIILISAGNIFPSYKKWTIKSQIAFGPFLVLGTLLTFFFFDSIIKFLNLFFNLNYF